MSRWKLFLILILAVVLLHILIIKIFIIGSSDEQTLKPSASASESAAGRTAVFPEPQLPAKLRRK